MRKISFRLVWVCIAVALGLLTDFFITRGEVCTVPRWMVDFMVLAAIMQFSWAIAREGLLRYAQKTKKDSVPVAVFLRFFLRVSIAILFVATLGLPEA